MTTCYFCSEPIRVVTVRMGPLVGGGKQLFDVCRECWTELTRKREARK